MTSGDSDARVEVYIVVDDSVEPAITYQVPVVTRLLPSPGDDRRVIGVVDGATLVDGPHDEAYARALLGALQPHASPTATPPVLAMHRDVPSRVLDGEQSNTSIIFTPDAGAPVICKVFRQLNPGVNPDIELQSALARAGSPHVPQSVGHIEADWADPRDPGRTVTGSLVFAQEFLPGVEDAWRVAGRTAAGRGSFAAAAHALGAATADVHLSLARLFPTVDADPAARAAVAEAWQRRLSIAVSEVPAISRHRSAIAAVYARALDILWPPLQRIHGDLHLGQVLQTPGKGWVLVDFEGEPMRPIRERRLPDSPLRDIAGMLRSFDYVAGSLRDTSTSDLDAWSHASRDAFLGGYEHRAGTPTTGPLLDAFELDKAVYEAIYEARNRPGWLSIPLAAIERLVREHAPGADRNPPPR